MTAKVAYVAVENAILHFDHAFSYRIPEGMNVQPGCRVAIPFGRGNRKRQGIVLRIGEEQNADLKEISELLDHEPVLNDEMLRMCGFMKSHCFCTYYDAVRAMLPAGINYRLSFEYAVSGDLGDRFYDLPDEWRRIVTIIRSKNNKAERQVLLQELGLSDSSILDEMEEDGVLKKNDTALRKIGDKTIKMIRLSDEAETLLHGMKLSQKQESVINLLSTVGSASVKEVCYYTGVTASVPDTLVRKGIAVYFDDEVFRVPQYNASEKRDVTLTDEQQKAFDELSELYESDSPEVSLLYGITGSGKTSVFFKLIEKAVADTAGLKTDAVYATEEAGIAKLKKSVDLDLYRAAERNEIQEILDSTEEAISKSEDQAEINALIKKAKAKFGKFKTDAEYTAEEEAARQAAEAAAAASRKSKKKKSSGSQGCVGTGSDVFN